MLDPFDTLGIAPTFDIDVGAVEKRYRDLSRVLHPDKFVGTSAAERRMSLGKAVEVNEAWRLVRDPIRRAEALLRRHGVDVIEGTEAKADPEFLMEMMEQREALSEAKAKHDPATVQTLATRIRAKEMDILERLARGFSQTNSDDNALLGLVPLVGELRYYRRFLDEVSSIEEAS
jgi:molecular chaperone HscB